MPLRPAALENAESTHWGRDDGNIDGTIDTHCRRTECCLQNVLTAFRPFAVEHAILLVGAKSDSEGSVLLRNQCGRADQIDGNSTAALLEEAHQLVLGREAYEHRAWEDAYQFPARVSEAASLAVDDIERLAMSPYLTGRDEEYLHALERTGWARLVFRGEMAQATG